MRRLLMLDSGAFSVWNKGATIDLDSYIAFCRQHPDVSYYVNLDVIPGIPNNKRSLTKENKEASCKRGWNNYLKMVKELPFDKVIPVFHQNDPIEWLNKYLGYGTPYIGISPANDCTTSNRIEWMDARDFWSDNIRRRLFYRSGKPLVKTHGFAVTSYRLMNLWEWHSVDSASWKMSAATGNIYIPRRTGDYTQPPLLVGMSAMSPLRKKVAESHTHFDHFLRKGSKLKERVLDYLEEVGVELGSFKVVKVKKGYKLKPGWEFWYNRKNREVLHVEKKGVQTHWEVRSLVNAYFMKKVMDTRSVKVRHIYFAGAPREEIEPYLGKRLLTYHDMRTGENSKCRKILNMHLDYIRNKEQW